MPPSTGLKITRPAPGIESECKYVKDSRDTERERRGSNCIFRLWTLKKDLLLPNPVKIWACWWIHFQLSPTWGEEEKEERGRERERERWGEGESWNGRDCLSFLLSGEVLYSHDKQHTHTHSHTHTLTTNSTYLIFWTDTLQNRTRST